MLTKDGRKLILQGMIHVAPVEVYRLLQDDMNNKVNEGYKVFFEGIRDYPKLRSQASEREHEIAEFFKTIFDIYPILAIIWGFELQKKQIKYPEDAINADISFKELARLLAESGFKGGFIKQVLKDKKIKERVKRDLSKEDPFKKRRKGFLDFFLWFFFFRKLDPIILDYRNKITIITIERYSASRDLQKIFIHYGEQHVPGMIDLLKNKGWKLASVSKLDLSIFRPKGK